MGGIGGGGFEGRRLGLWGGGGRRVVDGGIILCLVCVGKENVGLEGRGGFVEVRVLKRVGLRESWVIVDDVLVFVVVDGGCWSGRKEGRVMRGVV